MRALVTGGAGFLGLHLVRRLLDRGADVVVLDNFCTSDRPPLEALMAEQPVTLIEGDVSYPPRLEGPFDLIAHLACPASPEHYMRLGLETLAVGSRGSEFVLDLAANTGARVLLASTSEVYGDPAESPQAETYWGHVNPIGPRSVYDEAKRYSEAFFTEHRRRYATNTAIVRIFNTYGPGLRPSDGRVVSNFIDQALGGRDLTVYGDGLQTRSLCYVDDLVAGLLAMIDSDHPGPVNLGNPNELTVSELAKLVLRLTGSHSGVVHLPAQQDDPAQRCPDIGLASRVLGWSPQVDLETGLARTISWQQSQHALLANALDEKG